MGEKKKMKLIIPEGMSWPEGLELPEIEVAEASIRRTKLGPGGELTEETEAVQLPVIPEK